MMYGGAVVLYATTAVLEWATGPYWKWAFIVPLHPAFGAYAIRFLPRGLSRLRG